MVELRPVIDRPTVEVPDDAVCLGCGYALRGLAEAKCPECGRGFRPPNRSSYRRLGERSRVKAWLGRGPGWVLGSGVILTALVCVYAASVPGGYLGWGMLGVLGVIVFGPFWLLRIMMCLVWSYGNEVLEENGWRYWRRWGIPAGFALLGLVLLMTGAPERLRFATARPGLVSLHHQVQAGGSPGSKVMVGGTEFNRVEPYGQGGTVFYIDGAGFMDAFGWAYLPDAQDQATAVAGGGGSPLSFERYSGDWFLVHEHW